MSNTPHELHEEFPEKTDKIHEMKVGNPHFSKLYDDYHAANRAVHRAETNVEPMEALAENELRKKRAVLKDELYKMLSA